MTCSPGRGGDPSRTSARAAHPALFLGAGDPHTHVSSARLGSPPPLPLSPPCDVQALEADPGAFLELLIMYSSGGAWFPDHRETQMGLNPVPPGLSPDWLSSSAYPAPSHGDWLRGESFSQ